MKKHLLILFAGLGVSASVQALEPVESGEPSPSSSRYIDVYYGSFLAHARGTFEASRESGNPRMPQSEDLSGGSVKTVGITMGNWVGAPAFSLGTAMELGYLSYESGHVDLDTLTMSGLLKMKSSMLKTRSVPDGRIRPYAGLGIAFLWGDLDATIYMEDGSLVYGDEIVLGIGLDARTGLSFMVTEKFGLFAEYRYLWFYVASTKSESSWGWPTLKGYEALDMDLGLGQAVVGLTFTY